MPTTLQVEMSTKDYKNIIVINQVPIHKIMKYVVVFFIILRF